MPVIGVRGVKLDAESRIFSEDDLPFFRSDDKVVPVAVLNGNAGMASGGTFGECAEKR